MEFRKEPTLPPSANSGHAYETTNYTQGGHRLRFFKGGKAQFVTVGIIGVTFRRQHAVGKYIPDFCSPKVKLIIELDGSQHLAQEKYDQERTKYLESLGYKVIRFWNNAVLNNIDGVILAIIHAMEDESDKA